VNFLCPRDEGFEVQLHGFLKSAVDKGEWLTSRHGRFTHEKKASHLPNSRFFGPQSRSGCFGEQEHFLLLPRFEPLTA